MSAKDLDRHWTALIVESVDLAGAVRYIIEVVEPPRKWLIRKRYREFREMDQGLKKEFTAGLPKLPPKCFSPFGPDAAFLESRRAALQHYLDTLAAAPPFLKAHPLVVAFIAPRQAAPRAAAAAGASKAIDVPELPSFFPDLPVRGHVGADAVVARASRALRQLVVFQYSIEADEGDALRQCATFDVQRAAVVEATVTLRSLLPELDRQLAEALRSQVELRAEFLSVAHRAIAWAETYDLQEAAAIKAALRDPGTEVRPLQWYEGQVAQALSDFSAPSSELGDASKPRVVEQLAGQIRHEMETRSKANQAASVTRLRALLSTVESPSSRGSLVERLRSHEVTPQSVLSMLQKRAKDMSAAVSKQVTGESGDDVPQVEVVARLEQLASDVRSFRTELKTEPASAGVEKSLEEILEIVADLKARLAPPVPLGSSETTKASGTKPTDEMFKL